MEAARLHCAHSGRQTISDRLYEADDPPLGRVAEKSSRILTTIGDLDHLLVVAGETDGSWGAFMDHGMEGTRGYVNTKFFGSWACARYARRHLAAHGSITFLTGASRPAPRSR